MEVNNTSGEIQNGAETSVVSLPAAPTGGERAKPRTGTGNRKRRRGKHKRKIMKPFIRPRTWSAERRRAGEERLRRARLQQASETGAPYNNNQFLMEIHAPEPEPRTRDSSFSVDSEDNYLYSLPEDETEFLTKEFSSVYEDAASERLAALTKPQLLEEYLSLEARYESVSRGGEEELRRRVRELELENQQLRQQLERLRPAQRAPSSSADSESDSASSLSSARSSRASSPRAPADSHEPAAEDEPQVLVNGHCNGKVSPSSSPFCNGHVEDEDV